MKKTVVALAALAFVGVASAQSSVTLFGRLDAGVGQINVEETGKADNNQTVVNSSTFRTTYWGLKGSEDLGGGLKANFNLQSGFAIDTGVGNTGLFERNATVGLSGGFGTVNLGRQYTPYYAIYGATVMIENANVDAQAVYAAGIKQDVTRSSNSIRYDSPSFGGFSVSGLVGLGENDGLAGNLGGDATDTYSLNLMYKAGPLLVGYGYHLNKLAQNTVGASQDENEHHMVGAAYDFGMAKVTGGYQRVSNDTTDDDEYNVGVIVPIGSALRVMLGYADSSSETAGFELNSDGFTLAAEYSLSKRTKMYGTYANTSIESGTLGAVSTKETDKFVVGVVHLF